ncbi:hypothetical protein C1X35_31375 [Pseudomonas sp. FW306-1C-G01A]|uniref:hypothetical protein n=1 Tax=unclassified Pseudomonas TaxID=196821 RepID=UPI000C86AE48|nr:MULTISPECIES: hypothetical protein [unclassified Pseudomonas]PMV86760.1 hypothetical protein C1X56_14025 [Pseudomonas sp. GW101-1A09]PMV94517.1 hypothetical protein C1X51_12675 [Pseudomonas sp. FW306-2-2C-B10A]PMW04415.1 hypothetical protein C1X50_18340 [Pseudomonas sp. MPR-TSA4]PMW08462.1 hypothetical protein C1X52_29460 [Pseudomonas sp. FW306-2-1A-C05A]PMW30005.1 hypothetical protein C1X49_29405 [Pseudomonas sp. MPR-E5]
MKVSEEITAQICDAIPTVTPLLLESVFNVAGKDSQILFDQGEGRQVIEGKVSYPDYLQVQISDAQEAMRLAQQLLNACADAMHNSGELRSPVTLLVAGQASLSE